MILKGISAAGFQRIAQEQSRQDALAYLGGQYNDTDDSFYAEMYDLVEEFPVPDTVQEAYHARDLAIMINQVVQKGYKAFMDLVGGGARTAQDESWLEYDPDEPTPYVFNRDQVPYDVQYHIKNTLDYIGTLYDDIGGVFFNVRHNKKEIPVDEVSGMFDKLAQESSKLVDLLGSSFG